ncbi:response regulator [bacterium]|nr:response regulator [bacterium]
MEALIVEDNDTNYLLVKTILKREGWSVEQARTLDGFRNGIEAKSYDLILLDVSLPDGDGIEALEALHRTKEEMPPVFVMTAHALKECQDRASAAGASAFFAKPFSVTALQSAVRALGAGGPC